MQTVMNCGCGYVSEEQSKIQRGTYHTCLHQSCPHSRCRSHIASGQAHSGCFYSGTGMAHMYAHLSTKQT